MRANVYDGPMAITSRIELPELRRHPAELRPLSAVGAAVNGFRFSGPTAVSALAVGACSVGAMAIGALAIRRLAIGRAQIQTLSIEELEVGKLKVREIEIESPDGPGAAP